MVLWLVLLWELESLAVERQENTQKRCEMRGISIQMRQMEQIYPEFFATANSNTHSPMKKGLPMAALLGPGSETRWAPS